MFKGVGPGVNPAEAIGVRENRRGVLDLDRCYCILQCKCFCKIEHDTFHIIDH